MSCGTSGCISNRELKVVRHLRNQRLRRGKRASQIENWKDTTSCTAAATSAGISNRELKGEARHVSTPRPTPNYASQIENWKSRSLGLKTLSDTSRISNRELKDLDNHAACQARWEGISNRELKAFSVAEPLSGDCVAASQIENWKHVGVCGERCVEHRHLCISNRELKDEHHSSEPPWKLILHLK